ncbi:MAG: DUF6295 family protein [Hyphomicrobiaceae bacterium]
MCTSIVEIAPADGMAKGEKEWFPVTRSVVAYDHARHALLGDVITLDFINSDLPPGARAAVELTLESAKALRAALDKAIAEAEVEEAERADSIARQKLAAARRKVRARVEA